MFRTRLLSLVLIFVASACAALPAAPEPPASPPPLEKTSTPAAAKEREAVRVLARARIAAVGDVLMHGAVKDAARAADRRDESGRSLNHEGYADLFEGVADALRDADLGFANLETPVAPKADKGSRPFVFNAPAALLPALRDAGVGFVSFANNHVFDQGMAGFVETIERLEAADFPFAGAGRSCEEARRARIVEVQGIRIAFIAGTMLFNENHNRKPSDPCAFALDERLALEAQRKAREAGAELVILSAHWGVEYEVAPRKQEIELAHRLLDGGFDAILGHHPHVLQPVEVYETKDGRITFVAYSLGNFISNQSRTYAHGVQPAKMGNTRDGVILRFSALRKRYGDDDVRVELGELYAEPLWTDNNALARQRDQKLASHIRVVHVDAAIEAARAELEKAEAEQALRLRKRIELLEARRAIAAGIVGEDLLR